MIAMMHELDSACEATQLRYNFQNQCRSGRRLWYLLPKALQVTAVCLVRQYEKSFAVNHGCYPVYKMWVISLAQLAEVLRFHFPRAACGQAQVVGSEEVLEHFDRYATRFAALLVI